MSDAGIGRLLISSLHQGISDVAPTRLEFYENWLSPTGMRDGRIGLAPLGAVLSFLHREEPPINEQITLRAGTCAADWTFADAAALRRWTIRRLPTPLRVRAALGLLKRVARATIRQAKVTASLGAAGGAVEIRSAAFEQLRDPASIPMRAFYAAAFQRLLSLCLVDAEVGAGAASDAGWTLTLTVRSARRVEAVDAA
jgi:hypothetical protein